MKYIIDNDTKVWCGRCGTWHGIRDLQESTGIIGVRFSCGCGVFLLKSVRKVDRYELNTLNSVPKREIKVADMTGKIRVLKGKKLTIEARDGLIEKVTRG